MRVILPGRPQRKQQAVTVGLWQGRRIIAYISGNALVVLNGPNELLQTTYHETETDLVAIALAGSCGKIAVCSDTRVYVYKPYGKEEGQLKWSLQCELPAGKDGQHITALSWGDEDELLVATSVLALYSTNSPELLWSKPLASKVRVAQFSHDATLIASVGTYDRFVKVWRRLSFGTTSYRFDYAYLPHPTTVTGMHWRQPLHGEQSGEQPILYTFCADKKLRVWVTGDIYVLRLWTQIDLTESIQTRILMAPDQPSKRYAFIISARDFKISTERALQHCSNSEKEKHALDHLIEVADRTPEVCMVLDDRGNMSAWGLETMDCKTRQRRDPFNIAHVEGLRFRFARDASLRDDNVQVQSFCTNDNTGNLAILVHHFDGRIEWLEGRTDEIFDPSPGGQRLQRKNVWTGHSSAITKLRRSTTGKAFISRTDANESIIWVQKASRDGTRIARHCVFEDEETILKTAILRDGDFMVYLHHGSISLWDTRRPTARLVSRHEYHVRGEPLCLIVVPEMNQDPNVSHLATITTGMKGVAWEVRLPPANDTSITQSDEITASLEEFQSFDLGSKTDLAFVLPVDPAGSDSVISGFLDTFARDVAVSLTKSGVLNTWTAKVNPAKQRLDWLLTATVETSIENPSLVAGTSIRKAAIVDEDKETLTIWNTTSAQLEYEQTFRDQGVIQDLDWSSTPDNQSILAVGFPHKVVIYTQLRYDYLNRGPSWTPVREISIRDLTPHPIGDSVWLGNGSLAIGAGNQLFIQDEKVDVSESLLPDVRMLPRKDVQLGIFSLASHLNGPLPVYHPQFLMQCMLAGKLAVVQRVLVNLFRKLKFFTEGDELESFLGMSTAEFFQGYEDPMASSRRDLNSSYADFSEDEDMATVTEEVAASLNELLTKVQIPHLSSQEQFHLADVVECVGTVERHRRSVDENAARFLIFFRQHALRASQHHSSSPPMISWREIAWAYHSNSQDILVDLVTKHFHGKLLWRHARESGLFMWLTDAAAVKAQFEVIARNEYTKSEEKNPIDCSLYYLALKKKAVLAGLWRMASWHREQQSTQRLLANNFLEQRWNTAALKNAYALMGKRRFEYAAAFFLLADHLQDAVSVISTQLGDMQLAIAVARVYEGDGGPVLTQFLEDRVLPLAVQEGNRWLATWAFWMLSRRDKAVRALVTPLSELLSPITSPNLQSKLFLADDPALVFLYQHLREKSLQTLRGAVMVTTRTEWDFVLHTARLYGRMGCDVLALDLVRSWEFLSPAPPATFSLTSPAITVGVAATSPPPMHHHRRSSDFFDRHQPTSPSVPRSPLDSRDFDPRKLLRRRGSLVVADLPTTRESIWGTTAAAPLSSPDERIREEGDVDGDESRGASSAEANGVAVNGDGHGGRHEGLGIKTAGKDGEQVGKGGSKPPPTQFKEPDANSLLDSFGF